MKKELIKTTGYLLVVDDSEIKEGDCYLSPSGIWFYNHLNPNHVKKCKKIIAHLPLNNSLILKGVPLLPSLEVEDDVEKLGNEFSNGFALHLSHQLVVALNEGFKAGYLKAREKSKYTEEDAKYLFECGRNFQINADITFTVAREHLSQPKMPTHFEFETESMSLDEIREHGKGFLHGPTFKIKTTTNSQGQEVACGKYIY